MVLGFNFDLVDQLTFYGSYHANPLNVRRAGLHRPAWSWGAAGGARPPLAELPSQPPPPPPRSN